MSGSGMISQGVGGETGAVYWEKGWIDKEEFCRRAADEAGKSINLRSIEHVYLRWEWHIIENQKCYIMAKHTEEKKSSFKATLVPINQVWFHEEE